MLLELVTPPATLPVSPTVAAEWSRVLAGESDGLLNTLIGDVTSYLDGPTGMLGRAIVTQVWRYEVAGFSEVGEIPLDPVQSVAIQYDDPAGSVQTVDPGLYRIARPLGRRPRIILSDDAAWPVSGSGDWPVRLEITAGYGPAEEVPCDLRRAIVMMVADLYDRREAQLDSAVSANPMADAMLSRHRRHF